MWIFCCGMQRSGSTLQFQITAQLVEEAGLGKRVEWVKHKRFPKLRKKYAAYEGWKVFDNHTCTDAMKEEFHRQNAMGVYVFRDLRDVIVSKIRKYSQSFEQLWNVGFLDNCLQQYHNWTS
ncbi:MAG: sulfotransferase domain-containing protein, partial [bacterium]